MKALVVCALVILCQYCIYAQVPQDFEFLNHDSRFSNILESHIFPDGILYVTSKDEASPTRIVKVNWDNEVELVYETFYYAKNAKKK